MINQPLCKQGFLFIKIIERFRGDRKMAKKYIIFDFDGTIADTFKVVEKIGMELAPKYQVQLDTQVAREIGLKGLLHKLKFPMWMIPKILIEMKEKLTEYIKDEAVLFPGMELVLNELSQRYTLGIVSSNSKENIECFLKKHSVLNLFSFIHSDSSLFGKDQILKRLCKKHQIKNQEMLYVGDEDRDIWAAKKFGVKIIAVSWGYNSKTLLTREKPDFLIDKPQEIMLTMSSL